MLAALQYTALIALGVRWEVRLASMDTLLAGPWMVSGSHPGWSKGSGATECWTRHVVEEPGWGGVLRQMQGMVEKGFWASLQASESGPLGSMDLEALLLQTLQEKGVSAEVTREVHMAFSGSGQILSLFCGSEEIGGLV